MLRRTCPRRVEAVTNGAESYFVAVYGEFIETFNAGSDGII
jgi:hypothetical protein